MELLRRLYFEGFQRIHYDRYYERLTAKRKVYLINKSTNEEIKLCKLQKNSACIATTEAASVVAIYTLKFLVTSARRLDSQYELMPGRESQCDSVRRTTD